MRGAITKKQIEALERLKAGGRSTPYSLGVSIGTLESLRARGMVSVDRSQVGSIARPKTRVFWDITEAGKLAIFEQALAGVIGRRN